MPRLSVIIPMYNAAKFARKCVRSVLEQSFKDFELILVDDGSADDTLQICRELAAEDARVRILRQQNLGVSAARNAGMDAARGDYIAFVDADDWLSPPAYERMFRALDSTDAGCAVSGYFLIWPDGTVLAQPAPMKEGYYSRREIMSGLVLPLLADRVSLGLVFGAVWRYLFKRSVISDNSIRFSGAYLEDEIFLIKYFTVSGGALAAVDEPLYFYFQNPMSVTRRYLSGYVDTFKASLAMKESLVARLSIPAPPYWRDNTCWAGLLISVSNEFAPGNTKSFAGKLTEIKSICAIPEFKRAVKDYIPRNMARNKAVVAWLIRKRLYFPLALLYTLKSRSGRSR